MKKAAIITSVIAGTFILAILIVPMFLKGTILDVIKKTANDNLNATLNFSDASVSLLQDFPRITAGITDVSVANLPPFHDTLFRAKNVEVSLDVWTLITESRAEILALHLESPTVFAHVLPDSSTNWSITKPSEKTSETEAMHVNLHEISIADGTVRFIDEAGGKQLNLDGLNVSGTGAYSGNICSLTTDVGAIATFSKGGIKMLDSVKMQGKSSVEIDLSKQHYTLNKNEFLLNELPLSITGWLELGEKYMDFDMSMKASSPDFKGFLSVVPKLYAKHGGMQSVSGSASVEGRLKGRMDDNNLPGFSLAVLVQNGAFQGKQSPVGIKNIEMNLAVNNTDGKPDHTVIDLKKLSLLAGGDPFSLRAMVKTPVSDPFIDAAMNGRINLATWKPNMTLQPGTDINGIITADITLRGNVSAIKAKNFGKFTATGKIDLTNLTANTATLPAPLSIRTASLVMSPQFAALSNLDGTIGASDFRAEGRVDNIVGFMLADEDLTGSLTVNSRKFDCNPWLGLTKASPKQGDALPAKPVELPGHIDFSFATVVGEVLYDNITARNVSARLRLKNKVLTIENAAMDAVGGNIAMTGTFDGRNPAKPHSKFDLTLKKIDIGEAYKTFGTAQTFAPFLAFMRGSFDAGMNLDTDLGNDMKPDFPTLSSLGGLNIERISVEGFKPFTQVSGLLKMEALSNPTLSQIASKFAIEKGRFFIRRTPVKFGGYDGVLQGSNGLDKSIDYVLTLNLPAGSLPQQANAAISKLIKKEVTAFGNSAVPVNITFKGTFDNPQVSVSLDNAVAGQLESAAKVLQDEAKRKIEEEKQKLEQRAKDEEQKLRQKAKDEEDRLKQKAREEEEKARKKIADEQERLKKKAEEEARKKAEEGLKKVLPNPFSKPK